MADNSPELSLIHSSSGASAAHDLPRNAGFILRVRDPLAGAFTVDIQEGDGTDFADLYNGNDKVTFSDTGTSRAIRVPGGVSYRMNITTYNNPLTFEAFRINS